MQNLISNLPIWSILYRRNWHFCSFICINKTRTIVVGTISNASFSLADTYGVEIAINEDQAFILALVIVIDQFNNWFFGTFSFYVTIYKRRIHFFVVVKNKIKDQIRLLIQIFSGTATSPQKFFFCLRRRMLKYSYIV
jgi:hypothetical protein